MSVAEADSAGRMQLVPVGDGVWYPTAAAGHTYGPTADPGLSALMVGGSGGGGDGHVGCLSATEAHGSPSVTTPQGVGLGSSLAQLRAAYGSRLVFVPSRDYGINPRAGYEVGFGGGTLVFFLSRVTTGTVHQIYAGPGIAPGWDCS